MAIIAFELNIVEKALDIELFFFIPGICCKDAVKNEKKFKADNEAYQKNFQKITALKIHNKI